MVSGDVLTAAPVDVERRPELAMALLAWLRALSPAIGVVVAVLLPRCCAGALVNTVPSSGWVACVPLTGPPPVLTYIWLNISGPCQNSGATSMTTWYWFLAA